jgi:hypothetical protein
MSVGSSAGESASGAVEQPKRRSVPRGLGVFVIGILLIVGGGLLYGSLSTRSGPAGLLPPLIVFGAAGYAGNRLLRRSRKLLTIDAYDRIAYDVRPPVLYLRSFGDDERRYRTPFFRNRGKRLSSPFELLMGRFSTYEERLAHALKRFGPVVAIGNPSDPTPALGASRAYVGDDEWKDRVMDLLGRAGLVVVQIGDSQGLAWEIAQVVARVEPERLLLSLPLEPKRIDRPDRDRYERFRTGPGANVFPQALPVDPGSALFIHFGPDWAPRLFSPLAKPSSEAGQPSTKTLSALRSEFGPHRGRFAFRMAMATLLGVIGLGGLVVWIAITQDADYTYSSEDAARDLAEVDAVGEPAIEWQTLAPESAGFSIDVPGPALEQSQTTKTAAGPIRWTTYGVDDITASYMLIVGHYPTGWRPSRETLANAHDGAVESAGGNVLTSRWGRDRGRPTVRSTVNIPNGGVDRVWHFRGLVSGQKLYLAYGPGLEGKTFVSSLRVDP